MLKYEVLERRALLAGDLLVRYEFTDVAQNPVESLRVGDDFLLRAFVQDIRRDPAGLWKAYFDVDYDPDDNHLASVVIPTNPAESPITHGPDYSELISGDASQSGLIDEVGGLDTDQLEPTSPGAEFLLFSVRFHADAAGILRLETKLADAQDHTVQFHDLLSDLPLNRIDFANTSIEIVGATIEVTPTSGLTTSESGDTASFSIKLSMEPTASVTIGLSSSDAGEGTVSPSSVTFEPGNWATPQSVTVTGVDDFLVDGDTAYTIVTADAVSSDPQYSGKNVADVSVTNLDDDVAGFTVTQTGGSTQVSESGTTDTFSVALDAQPVSNVVILVSSSDTGEVVVDKSSLTFTPANWNSPQTVTVTGQDDPVVDGQQQSTVTLSISDAASDNHFDPLPDQTVAVITSDNDEAGFTVVQTGGSTQVSETGTTDTFSVVLDAQPLSNVVLRVASGDTSEATVDKVSLTFTPANWSTPQIVTVTGVDDPAVDGTQTTSVTIAVDPAASDDNFDSLPAQTVAVTTTSNDLAGFAVNETGGGTVVSESGATDTFNVVLSAQPVANVVILVSSGDASEATVDKTSLTFTPGNWNVPQIVTVTGHDDPQVDGPQTTAITLRIDDAASDDHFDLLADRTVTVTTTDDDAAGFTVTETGGGTQVSESGTTDAVEVVLAAQPLSDVVIAVSSSDPGEATVDKATLTFTAANWNVPQTVTLTGEDDQLVDGAQSTTITFSIDDAESNDAFDPLPDQTIVVTTLDDDVPGITVIAAPGLSTTEGGGTATFQIVLDKQPGADVVVGLTSSDPTEGTLSVDHVTFTPADWSQPQTITVTGVDDFLVDGSQTYTIVTAPASSTDGEYDGLDAADVSLVNVDDDQAGFTISQTGGNTRVSEIGTTDTFTVVLAARPESDVVIAVASADTTEATVDKGSLTFTPDNWNVPQTVTVTGQDDDVLDGPQSTAVTLSIDDAQSDDAFDGVEDKIVTVTTADDDAPGFVVVETGGVTEVAESGTTDTLTIVLTVQPVSNVVLDLSAGDPTEATTDKTSLTFSPANWNQPQMVTVTGVDDKLIDGARTSAIIVSVDAAASDDAFDAVEDQAVTVTTSDDDLAGFKVAETDGDTVVSEDGSTDTFTVTLIAEPDSNVVIRVLTQDGGEVAADKTALTFTPGNWDVPQTVTITGEDDHVLDGDQTTNVILSIDDAASDDNFDPLADRAIAVTTTDNDVAGFAVAETDGETVVSESGTTDSLSVTLTVQPASDVVILVSADSQVEATLDKSSLTFTPANWNVPQTVTVTGKDDHVLDGDQTTTVTLAVDAANSDDAFDAVADETVTVTTEDDDVAGFTVIETGGGTEVSESGTTDTFGVRLTVRPETDVVIVLSGHDAGEMLPDKTSLTFTPDDWDVIQTVTLTGQDDDMVDGDQVSQLVLSVDAVNSDGAFGAVGDTTVAAVTTDDDSATLTITPVMASLDEGGSGTTGTVSFLVTLSGQVEGGFTVAYATEDGSATTAGGDYVAADATLTFDGADGESKTISIVVNGDDVVEADEQFAVRLGTLSGIDPSAAENIQPAGSPAAATIVNDDTATLTIAGVSQAEGTGGGTTGMVFNVTLSNAVQGGFGVAYAIEDGEATVADGDYLPGDGTLQFAGTAGEVQTVVVQVAADAKVERDETLTVTLGGLSGLADAGMAADLTVDDTPAVGTIENDDTATVSFASAASSGLEAAGTHTIQVQLNVPAGGSIGEAVTVAIIDLLTGTAQTPADYTLATTSVTFPAGSEDGDTMPVTVTTVNDSATETAETINLKLEVAGDAIAGAVTAGTPQEHTLTVADDPGTASISGVVWADTNDNGVIDANEGGLPGVTITLSGTDGQGRTIEIVTVTDAEGGYEFADLPGGTYVVRQTQPIAFHDGREWLGKVEGAASGQAGEDRFTGVVLGAGEAGQDYNFGEWGLKAKYVSRRALRASSPPAQQIIREAIAQAEQIEGDSAQAKAIREGRTVEIRRIGSQVTVTGSQAKDSFAFIPADSVDSQDATKHTLKANGMSWTFDTDEVSEFVLDGAGGNDTVEINDSAEHDVLTASGTTATLQSVDFRLDAIDFEMVKALSHSGGDDDAEKDIIDFVLQLEGDWNQLN